MKAALVVGIDHYNQSPLQGCVNDALAMDDVLSRNHDHSINFGSRVLTSGETVVSRSLLRSNLDQLFSGSFEVALFYFSGHGLLNNLGGYLVTQDAVQFDEGVAMSEVLTMANRSNSKEVVIILDCCHSGDFGADSAIEKDSVVLRLGISVLCASRRSEAAMESGGHGLFSMLVCDGLRGGAANLVGDVTAADTYAFVSANLGTWDQRPLFKCNIESLTSLRKCDPQIELNELRKLPAIFPTPDELVIVPELSECSDGAEVDDYRYHIYYSLQKFRSCGLITPSNDQGAHMRKKLSDSKTCRLTKLGQYFWHKTKGGLI